MNKLYQNSAFISCMALLFAALATASTVLALFHPGATSLV